ncbi:MAG TPA: hypothetical protein VFE27_21990 [Acidobacteriaceae bacterium]|jgi:hypothetical protein|nr:hypothetical protein [Acidobacteriaceae bacterium]
MKKSTPVAAAGLPHGDLIGRELSNAVVFFHEAIASHLGWRRFFNHWGVGWLR